MVYTPSAYARFNESTRAKIDTSAPIGTGSFKYVYQGLYVAGPKEGERCVIKILKDSDEMVMKAFDCELDIVHKAQRMITKFNESGFINQTIYLNKPEVWTFEQDCDPAWAGKKCLCEPLIDGYVRFNSNTGFVKDDGMDWSLAMQVCRRPCTRPIRSHLAHPATSAECVL